MMFKLSHAQCRNHFMKMKLAFHYVTDTKTQDNESLRFVRLMQNKTKMINCFVSFF